MLIMAFGDLGNTGEKKGRQASFVHDGALAV
jgi:hypothetical protein